MPSSTSPRSSRREFLRRSALFTGGMLFQACSPKPTRLNLSTSEPTEPRPTETEITRAQALLTFLYTSDTHGHLSPFRLLEYPEPIGGIARRATLVRHIRSEADDVILVDVGNVHHGLSQSSLMADAFQGEPDIELMNELGYVAMGLGHHDIDYGWETFQHRREAAFFPILCANLVYADSGQPVLDTHTVIEEGGIKIALTSFASPSLWQATPIPGVAVADPIEAAQALVPRLKKQADLVVILGHQPPQDDRALASAVRGINIIIGRHAPVRRDEADQVGGALIVGAHKWGAYLGRLDVAVSGDKLTSYRYSLIPLTADVQADPILEARVGSLQAEMRQLYPDRFVRIGQAAVDISHQHVEFEETPLGNLVCDAIRQKAQADIALFASSQIANALFAGPLVAQDLHDALPYTNKIVTLRLSGEQLRQVLDFSASASGGGSFSQVSGVRFRIIGGVATEVTIDGHPLDASQTYLVAVPYRQVKLQDAYRDLFAIGTDLNEMDVTVKEALIEYIGAHSPIRAHKDGRIATE